MPQKNGTYKLFLLTRPIRFMHGYSLFMLLRRLFLFPEDNAKSGIDSRKPEPCKYPRVHVVPGLRKFWFCRLVCHSKGVRNHFCLSISPLSALYFLWYCFAQLTPVCKHFFQSLVFCISLVKFQHPHIYHLPSMPAHKLLLPSACRNT